MKSLSILILTLVVPAALGQMPPPKPPLPKPPMPKPPGHHHHHPPFFWPFLPRPQMPTIIMPSPSMPAPSNNYSYYSGSGYGQSSSPNGMGYGQAGTGYSQSASSAPQLPAPSASKARVQILLPTSAAVVWVDGYKLESGLSTTRVYTTPDLDRGQPNRYTVKAQWVHRGDNVVAEKIVTVTAGATATVDFTQEPPARANRAAAYQPPAAATPYEAPALTYPPQ